jgi:restriction system protein
VAEVARSGSAAWRRSGARPSARRKNREGWPGSGEKAAKEAHLLAQQGVAEAKSAAVEQQVRDLDEVLASALPRRPVSFSGLTAPSAPPRFEPGALAAGNPPPDWADFAPADPKGLARIFGVVIRQRHGTRLRGFPP